MKHRASIWHAVSLVIVVFVLGIVDIAHAADPVFLGGHIRWDRVAGNTANLYFRASLERSRYVCRDPVSEIVKLCSQPDLLPGVGDFIREDSGGTRIYFGDGASTPVLYFKVELISASENWLVGTAVHPGESSPTVSHQYSTAGPFTTYAQGCCRTSAVRNNAGGSYRVEAIVNFNLNNGNPRRAVAPVCWTEFYRA